jgi:uncharacterized delta-60 repeat protein
MNKACSALAIVALSLILASGSTLCAPGDLDPVFGVGGKIVVPDGEANAAVFDNEFGRDIIAGDAYGRGDLLLRVIRQLDPSFGDGGIVLNPNQPDGAADVILQPDLRIVTLGVSSGLFRECSLSRYEPNGAKDTSFGGIGTVRQSLPEDFFPVRLALQPDGKYVVVGTFYVDRFSRNIKLALLRFNSDGSLDHSFGESGIVSTSLGGSVEVYGFAVAVQSDGKIVVGGRSDVFPVVARFLTNGTLDPSFGSNGKVIFKSMSFGFFTANSLGVDALDDSVVFAATARASTTLVRLNPEGSLDDSFNGTGELSIPNFAAKSLIIGNGSLGPLHQVALAGAVVRFVNIAGRSSQFNTFAVAMVLPSGTLDQSYGKSGIATTPFTDSKEEYSEARGIVFTQSSGVAVAAGATLGPVRNVDIARYLAE